MKGYNYMVVFLSSLASLIFGNVPAQVHPLATLLVPFIGFSGRLSYIQRHIKYTDFVRYFAIGISCYFLLRIYTYVFLRTYA
jgi:hypothetical protein